MNTKIETLGFKADAKLLDFVEKKVAKLNRFHDSVVAVDVKLRLEKDESKENKIAEISLKVPQNDLFAKRQTVSFEESVDTVIDALKKQLEKHKERSSKR